MKDLTKLHSLASFLEIKGKEKCGFQQIRPSLSKRCDGGFKFCYAVKDFREGSRIASNGEYLHHPLLSKEQLMRRCIMVSSKALTLRGRYVTLYFIIREATSPHHWPHLTDGERWPLVLMVKASSEWCLSLTHSLSLSLYHTFGSKTCVSCRRNTAVVWGLMKDLPKFSHCLKTVYCGVLIC